MIVDLTIDNFKSIRDTETISFCADPNIDTIPNSCFSSNSGNIDILASSAIYGANASGKSNLLLAFDAIDYLISESYRLKDSEKIDVYTPYLLSVEKQKEPTAFELEFFVKEERFLYKIKYDSQKIFEESLDIYRSGKDRTVKANLFKRDNKGWEFVTFGVHLKGGKRKYAFFQNNSYLSVAGNRADSPPVIRRVYNYIRTRFVSIPKSKFQLIGWKEETDLVQKISKILPQVDTGILGLSFEDTSIDKQLSFPDFMPDDLKVKIVKDHSQKVMFTHKVDESEMEVKFEKDIESTGTRQLLRLMPFIVDVFEKGKVLIVDELDSSLHPHMAEMIINLFNDLEFNCNKAQLIFSTHSVALMSPDLMRRDQIWFTEKKQNSTSVYALSEYDKKVVRQNSPFGKWYSDGRFGAVPRINIDEVKKALRPNINNG